MCQRGSEHTLSRRLGSLVEERDYIGCRCDLYRLSVEVSRFHVLVANVADLQLNHVGRGEGHAPVADSQCTVCSLMR